MLDYICGIDPGSSSGGVTFLDLTGKIVCCVKMPAKTVLINGKNKIRFDMPAFRAVLKPYINCSVFIEHVHSMQNQGISSTFSFGEHFGELKGIVDTLGLPWVLISPQKWKNNLLGKRDKSIDIKVLSFMKAKELWPNETFLLTPRCSKPADGLYESALIAEYGRRQLIGNNL